MLQLEEGFRSLEHTDLVIRIMISLVVGLNL